MRNKLSPTMWPKLVYSWKKVTSYFLLWVYWKKKFTIKGLLKDNYLKKMFAKSFVLALLAASANAVSLETEQYGCGVPACQLP